MSNNQFFYPDTPTPQYCQFPKFLFHVPVSQTAKIVYTAVYDHARLSLRNGWIDDKGRVYTIYSHAKLAADVEKSVTQVRHGLNELVEADLLEKVYQPGMPNRLYVKIPSDFRQSETRQAGRRKSDREAGGKPTPKKTNRKHTQNQKESSAYGTGGSFSNGMERPPESKEEFMRWLAGRNGNLV